MKIFSLLLSALLLGCTAPKTEIPTDILSEKVFVNILKEVHLSEAKFELNKTKGMGKAKNELANSYQNIYSEYTISEEEFKLTLEYYSNHPEKLEKIYDKILKGLTKERTTLNP